MSVTVTVSTQLWPGFDINVTTLTGATVTVSRGWLGRSVPVRGCQRVTVTGAAMFFEDDEAPLGTPVVYTVTEYNGAGTATVTQVSAEATLPVVVPWLSDPLDPGSSFPVHLGPGSLGTLIKERPGEVADIQLSAVSVAAVGVRHEASGVPLSFIFTTQAELTALDELLAQADPVLLRLPPGWPGSRLMYLTIPATSQLTLSRPPVMAGYLTGTGQQVAPPGADVVKPSRTYGSVMVGQSYTNAKAAWATYLVARRGF